MIYPYRNNVPQLAPDVFVAQSAIVVGDVTIDQGSSIWFGSVVRGDVNYIRIGEGTNVQDGSILHVTKYKFPLVIGSHCTLGHRVTVHGCVLKDFAFLGIASTVLDGCEIGEFSILAAGSLLPPGKKIPPGTVAMGTPAKVIRDITTDEEEMIRRIPARYEKLKDEYGFAGSFGPGGMIDTEPTIHDNS